MALKRFNGNPEYYYDTVGDTHELTDNDIIPFTHKPGTEDDEDGKVKLSELKKYMNTTLTTSQTNALNSGITSTHVTKLNGIAAGAEVNVQSDWNTTDTSADSYIKNKPTNLVQDANYVHTDNNFTTTEKNKLSGIAAGAEVNVQSDWNTTDTSADSYIKNKPTNLVQDANYVHTDNNFTTTEKNKLSGIAAGAEVNVQPDWNQTDSTKDDYIKNKPTGITVVDSVANGNMNAVTSNAVYDALHAAISWNGSVLSITI